jgi:hypothetical protein
MTTSFSKPRSGDILLTGGFNPRQRRVHPVSKSRQGRHILFDVRRKTDVSSLAGLFGSTVSIIRRLKPPVNKVTPLAGLAAPPICHSQKVVEPVETTWREFNAIAVLPSPTVKGVARNAPTTQSTHRCV